MRWNWVQKVRSEFLLDLPGFIQVYSASLGFDNGAGTLKALAGWAVAPCRPPRLLGCFALGKKRN